MWKLHEAPPWVAVVTLALPFVGVVMLLVVRNQTQSAAEIARWRISGPSCPSYAGDVAKFRRQKAFDLDGYRFRRVYGHVECAGMTSGSLFASEERLVCQFTSPTFLEVTTPHGARSYETGIGRPATITIENGRATCVLGGWFRG
jgi:hypothetical protein